MKNTFIRHGVFTLGLVSAIAACATAPDLQAADKAAANTVLNPVPRRGWIDDHNDQVAEAKKIRPEVLFLGDSITAGWGNTGRRVWSQHYSSLKAARIAIPGDAIQNLLWRLQNGGIGGEIQPKVAVLMIGTNNGGASPEQITEGVAAIIKEIQGRSPGTKVLVLGLLPRGEKPNGWRAKNDKANILLAQLADEKTVWFLDFGAQFLQPDGTLTKALMPDFLHPSDAGYVIWADAMDAKLHELLK